MHADFESNTVQLQLQPSLPSLAALIRTALPCLPIDAFGRLVQAYAIQAETPEQEIAAATHVVRHCLDRLYRLRSAYAEWTTFDASAYFDIQPLQTAHLLRFSEHAGMLQCTFFVDRLLPSFQAVCQFYLRQWLPSYQQRHFDSISFDLFFGAQQPAFIAIWQSCMQVIRSVRKHLLDDFLFWTMNHAANERWLWRAAWEHPPAQEIDVRLTPLLHTVPTLTLAVEFPQPIARQIGRQRRLWRNREYRQTIRRWMRDDRQ
jgi:hypothetical protein